LSTRSTSINCGSTEVFKASGTRTPLESALARARNKWAYESEHDLAVLAAAYGYGIATNHPYRDGNKRIAFLTMVIFLGLNGWDLDAPESEVVSTMLALADYRCSEDELVRWLRDHMERS
jgi:death-on-curing protein